MVSSESCDTYIYTRLVSENTLSDIGSGLRISENSSGIKLTYEIASCRMSFRSLCVVRQPILSWRGSLLLILLFIFGLACAKTPNPLVLPIYATLTPEEQIPVNPESQATSVSYLPYVRRADDISILTPTPNPPLELPALRTEIEQYVVQVGDSLGIIARRFEVSLEAIIAANGINNPELLSVGQVLVIPPPQPGAPGEDFKIIPDSELVFGPLCDEFDVGEFIIRYDSFLRRYSQDVDGDILNGIEVVERVAREYSVCTRLLLAMLEYQSGWVTLANPEPNSRDFPMGWKDTRYTGLYKQMAWAANNLSRGYFLWRVNGVAAWLLADGSLAPVDPSINAGTAGVQQVFALLYDRENWDRAISEQGLFTTFSSFFGYSFDYSVIPLLPADLTQPEMQLPFEPGIIWAFTGGPHGGWADGSAWAALDFAPDVNGCAIRPEWVTAVADGLIVRAEYGEVVQDLDGDGNEGTGWTVIYMHIASSERVTAGTYLLAGERLGHPSCEGGFSTATHLHLARRYNGEWIAADQDVPFILDGWESVGTGYLYEGYLTRDGQTIEAWEGFLPGNTISRP